jgi:Ca-activated chloride channel family protein
VGAHVEGSRGEIRLRVGSLRPGAERRIVLRLAVDSEGAAARSSIESRMTWLTREGELVERNVDGVLFETTTDPAAMLDSRDAEVFASAVSAFASQDQLQAAEAYRRGDRAEAERLIERNLAALDEAEADAPADIKDGLSKQKRRYRSTQRSFGAAKPGSAAGRAAAKSAVQSDASNLGGVTF